MINFTLYKQGLKSNYKIFLIFLAILTMYTTIIIDMYNPELEDIFSQFAEAMPEMMAFAGMSGDATTLTGFMITYLYGFIFLMFPMIITIMLANRLVASHTDKGSMAYLLASSNSRSKIIFTQMKVLGTFIFALVLYITTLSIIMCQIRFPGELDIGKFLLLNVGLLFFHLSISGICFLASVIFNETKNSLLVGAGIPITFFLMNSLANMGSELEKLNYFTIFALFDARGIVDGNNNSYLMMLILLVIAIILYFVAFKIFKKKDLSV